MLRFLLAFALLAPVAAAQPEQTVLFPDLLGEELRAAVADAYRPTSVLDYARARDSMYAVVDRVERDGEEGVEGVYSGFFVPFDCSPSCDPSQDVFNQPNENTQGINAEHSWPRSFGADSGNPLSDIHHLFPTKVNVNADRGNLPFAESPDAQTTQWYREAEVRSSPPDASVIDLYSERRSGVAWEPREAKKGDIARALFYFYTMYRTEADANGGAAFFNTQKNTLYAWGYADPVDDTEYARTFRIALYQSDRANPFVLDSTLARRIYFTTSTATTETPWGTTRLTAAPSPFAETTTLTLALDTPQRVLAEVFDVLGRRVTVLYRGRMPGGVTRLRFGDNRLPAGIYTVRALLGEQVLTRRVVRVR